jgi:rsbT co-antagonist protein RsbR
MSTKYIEFLESQAQKIAEAVVKDVGSKVPGEGLDALVGDSVQVFTDSISAGPDLFDSWARKKNADLQQKDWSLGDVIACNASLRRNFIQVSLASVKDGQDGAEAGLSVLIGFCDAADRLAVESYDDDATELHVIKDILDNAVDGAAMAGLDAVFRYANPAMCEMLGYPDGLKGVSLTDIFESGGVDIPGITQQVIERGRWEGVLPFLRKDGGKFSGRLTIFPVRDAEGKPVGTAAIARDVTKEADMEEKLHRSRELLQSLIDHIPSIIYVKDLDKRYLLVNRFAADIMHLKPEEIIGKADNELFPPEVIDEWRKREERVLKLNGVHSYEDIFETDDGPHTFLGTLVTILDQQGKIYAFGGISTDVTELRRSEEERARLQEAALQAHKQALRELSTPMIPISDEVVAMPLIGPIDSHRARDILDNLTEGILEQSAEFAILDLTGVSVIDTLVADSLVKATQAARLLGAQVILTGVKPPVAQTMVQLGMDMRAFVTMGTLKSGIAWAMSRKNNG